MRAGSSDRDVSGTTAKSTNSGRQLHGLVDRVDEQVQREFALEPLGHQEVDQLPGGSGDSVPRNTPANSTWRKQVSSITPVGASLRGGSAKITSAGGLDP
jgi:hypothetical protein